MEYTLKPKRSYRETVSKFIYDSETRSLMGRDAKSWCRGLLFYLVFYSVLLALCSICMGTFYMGFIDTQFPRLQLQRSVIGTSPGMGFRPMPPNVKTTLIQYKPDDIEYWESKLVEFLSVYEGENVFSCDFDKELPPGKVCGMDLRLDPCTMENHFSYDTATPCIFIKLNKIYNWIPKFYNDTQDLPKDMPKTLRDEILKLTAVNKKQADMVWVSCNGTSAKDVESMGPVEYLPYPGFPGYFYPYLNTEGYLSPLVALYFKKPKTQMRIDIECRAWAKNIRYKRKDRQGSVRFELMIE